MSPTVAQAEETIFWCMCFLLILAREKAKKAEALLSSSIYLTLLRANRVTINYSVCSNKIAEIIIEDDMNRSLHY